MHKTGLSTRLLPGLKSEYAIVSLPRWAWIWLDDHIERYYANGYEEFIHDYQSFIESDTDLIHYLELLAHDLQEQSMREDHNLANDNEIYASAIWLRPYKPQKNRSEKAFKFPIIFQVFKFLPHATDMQTLWQRKNYEKYNY